MCRSLCLCYCMFIVFAVQEEVSIAKEEWELGHLKAIKEEDERRAEIEEDDMLYTSLHGSPQNKLSAGGKAAKSKSKRYSYGGWEFASFDDEAVASFLDDSGSQNVEDDTSTEPSLLESQLATIPQVKGRKRKANVVKTKPPGLKKMDASLLSVPKRKYFTKKRRTEFGAEEDSMEKAGARKRSKISPKGAKLQNLPKKVSRHVPEKAERTAAESVSLVGRNIIRPQLISSMVNRVPQLKTLKQFPRPSNVVQQHPPLVKPIRSSELGMRPRLVQMPVSRPCPRTTIRTIAEIRAQSSPRPTPILEKLGASVLASPSPMNQPAPTSRLTQIVSSISAAAALQNSVLVNSSSSGTVQYVITTNGQPAVQPVGQTSLLFGTARSSAAMGSNLRGTNVVYQLPAARHQPPVQTHYQPVSAVKPTQPPRLVLPSSTPSSAAARQQSFVLTAPGGDRQSYVLLPTSNRQSFILAPASSVSQPAVVTAALSVGSATGVVRPANFTIQMSPTRSPRAVQQQHIQPAPVQRTIQLAPTPPRPPPVANTLPILEKFALQLNSAQPGVAAAYEVVAHSGELIAATSPAKANLQQIVYPAASPPSQIVRLSGSAGTSGVQLVNHMVVGGSVAKPAVQTITMPQLVIRQPRPVAPQPSIITATPAVLPVGSQFAGPRIVSGTNLVQVPTSQLSTVIIVDSRQEGQDGSATAQHS